MPDFKPYLLPLITGCLSVELFTRNSSVFRQITGCIFLVLDGTLPQISGWNATRIFLLACLFVAISTGSMLFITWMQSFDRSRDHPKHLELSVLRNPPSRLRSQLRDCNGLDGIVDAQLMVVLHKILEAIRKPRHLSGLFSSNEIARNRNAAIFV